MQMHTLVTSDNPIRCFVSPMVVMSILNFYQRRDNKKKAEDQHITAFSVGLLFGKKKNNDIYITESFPIPCVYTEKEKTDEVM